MSFQLTLCCVSTNCNEIRIDVSVILLDGILGVCGGYADEKYEYHNGDGK